MGAQDKRNSSSGITVLIRHPAFGVFIAALIIRGIYILETIRHPGFLIPVIDAASYDTFASQWVLGGLRDSTTAWHGAFYPLFLTAVYYLFSPSVLAAKAVQLITGAAACAGISLVAGRVYGRRAAWTAGLAAALCGPLIFYEGELVPAGWSVVWSVALLALLIRKNLFSGPASGALLGLLAGGAALTRPELFGGLVGGLLVAGCTGLKQGRRGFRSALSSIPAAAGVFVLMILPAGFLNQRFTGTLSWLPANSGLNLYIGNSEDPCRTLGARPGPDYDRITNEPERQGLFTAAERNRYFIHRTLETAAGDPLQSIRTLAWKAGLLFSSREITADIDIYTARESSRILSLLAWKAGPLGFPLFVLLPLAAAGLAHPASRRLRPALLVFGIAALIMILYHPAARYRLALFPLLFVLAGGASELAGGIWCSRSRQIRAASAAAAAAAFGVSFLLPLTCLEQTDFQSERYRMIGQRMAGTEEGLQWLRRAYERDPRDPQTHVQFALAAARSDDIPTARQWLDHALTECPDYVMALALRAELAEREKRPGEARAALRKAVDADPDNGLLHYRLAVVESRDGNFSRALYHMEQALRFAPPAPALFNDYAALLIEAGQHGKAVPVLENLLRDFPGDPNLHINLAIASRELGQTARAGFHLNEAARLARGDTEIMDWIAREREALPDGDGHDR